MIVMITLDMVLLCKLVFISTLVYYTRVLLLVLQYNDISICSSHSTRSQLTSNTPSTRQKMKSSWVGNAMIGR